MFTSNSANMFTSGLAKIFTNNSVNMFNSGQANMLMSK